MGRKDDEHRHFKRSFTEPHPFVVMARDGRWYCGRKLVRGLVVPDWTDNFKLARRWPRLDLAEEAAWWARGFVNVVYAPDEDHRGKKAAA